MSDWDRRAEPPRRAGTAALPPPPSPHVGSAWGPRPTGPARGGPPDGGARAWLVVVLGLLLAAAVIAAAVLMPMGGEDDDGAPDVTDEELATVLLTEVDLGGGFVPDPASATDADTGDVTAMEAEVPDACSGELGSSTEILARAAVAFTGPDEASFEHTIERQPPGQRSLEVFRAVVDECDSFDIGDGEVAGTVTFTTTDLDGIGDDAVGIDYDFEGTAEGIEMRFDVYSVMWERGGVMSTVTAIGAIDASSFTGIDDTSLARHPVDQGWVRGLATRADARLAVLLDGARPT